MIKKDRRIETTARVADLNLLEPVTRRKVAAIINDARGHGVKVCVYETFRSEARQLALFHQGETELKEVGCHHYGVAADLVPLDRNGVPTWDHEAAEFRLIAKLAHTHRLITGADWGRPGIRHSFTDQPHVQRCTTGKRQTMLLRGEWYPGADYDPYLDLEAGF